MALKFSTGANDSLHPELAKAGFTPENATATLAALGKYLGAKAIKASINADLPWEKVWDAKDKKRNRSAKPTQT